MKRLFAVLLSLAIVSTFSACGRKQTNSVNPSDNSETTIESNITETTITEDLTTNTTEEEITTVQSNAQSVIIEGNTITVTDDGSGNSVDDNGMEKTPIVTTRGINYEAQLGPMLFKVNSIQVAKIKAENSDVASAVNIEVGQEATLISLDITCENTSDDDIAFYPDQSIVVTDHKEQISCMTFWSDNVGGDFLGNVEKTGQIFFIAEKTPADEIASFSIRIDAPHNSNYDKVSDDLKIDFNINK